MQFPKSQADRTPIDRLADAGLFDLSSPEQASAETLSVRIYRNIREALLSGVLSSGDQLNIRPMALAFQTSTMPVREAMTRLVNDGGLAAFAQRAFVVPEVAEDQLRELILIRARLEPMAVEFAATRQTFGSLHKIRTAFSSLETASTAADYLAAHRAFHFEIYATAGMPRLLQMIESLWLRMGPILKMSLRIADLAEEQAAHRRILIAVQDGDPAAAAEAVEWDLRTAANRTITLLHGSQTGT